MAATSAVASSSAYRSQTLPPSLDRNMAFMDPSISSSSSSPLPPPVLSHSASSRSSGVLNQGGRSQQLTSPSSSAQQEPSRLSERSSPHFPPPSFSPSDFYSPTSRINADAEPSRQDQSRPMVPSHDQLHQTRASSTQQQVASSSQQQASSSKVI